MESAELLQLNAAFRERQKQAVVVLSTIKKLNKVTEARAQEIGGETWKQWKADKEVMRLWLVEVTQQGGRFEAFAP